MEIICTHILDHEIMSQTWTSLLCEMRNRVKHTQLTLCAIMGHGV
jgi:hypothetical protein